MNQPLIIPFPNGITIQMKREDLIHPFVSGNKFRKLKYNLLQAEIENKRTLLTFGGAFSNQIAAVAFAGKEKEMKTIGIIRGDEITHTEILENPTLSFAQKCGMQFEFVSREMYRMKNEVSFVERLKQKFGDFYLIPEGGTNDLAIKGCKEILTQQDAPFNYICCAVGTGGTISGIIKSSLPHQKILGFPALKGDFLKNEIRNFVASSEFSAQKNLNWEIITDYHFGGYAKTTPELISFMNSFYKETNILLDPIYTGKMVFGVLDLINKNYFANNSKILLIHTGGIQGIEGMNMKLKKKQQPLINTYV